MAKVAYNPALCEELQAAANPPGLMVRHPRVRYEAGHKLAVGITGVFPAIAGQAELTVEKFLGGGFAGQVYRCRLTALELPAGAAIPGLAVGTRYAIKIIVPPSSFSRTFRNTMYWLAFQGPFSAQVNQGACRAGLLWQKLVRRAGRVQFGRETAVKDAYASFWDPELQAYGEITEWIEGRTWRLESDAELWRRWDWRHADLTQTASVEYVATRRFMAGMVELMHALGAPEFARQYEWSTMKSQPNVMKRTDVDEPGPEGGLCAIDFRAGLALLPFLPMSPGDFRLILLGLWQRGVLVQFDRCYPELLDYYTAQHPEVFRDMADLVAELKAQDRAYRRSLPDLTRHGFDLLTDGELRRDVRHGLVEGYLADGLADEAFAAKLRRGGWLFAVFYVLGALPVLGGFLRRVWGHAQRRAHYGRMLTSPRYLLLALDARAALVLQAWHRAGRVSAARVPVLRRHPARFFLERCTLGWLPSTRLHRAIVEPRQAWRRVREGLHFFVQFWRSADFREQWFLDLIAEGEKDGMLTPAERAQITAHVRDPFIIKYLKCLGVHFCCTPISHVTAFVVGVAGMVWVLVKGAAWADGLPHWVLNYLPDAIRHNPNPWPVAWGIFAAAQVFFQVIPISPGSFCRGAYVVYLAIRERNLRDYLIALPVSFVKTIGYIAFPLQMTATYPQLGRFLTARWITSVVHVVPVFGEKGALLEHWVFDLCYNVPQMIGRWARPRLGLLLTLWLLLGVGLTTWIIRHWHVQLSSAGGINLILATVVLFCLPRLVFLPLLTRPRAK